MSPFAIRGVIEGFYGIFYLPEERNDLIRFIGEHGYNFYLYGPKNDRQNRARWREPYPAKIMAHFRRTVEVANAAGVTFCFSLSPGVSMSYASEEDFACITDKFRAFYEIGVRAFSLLLDDIASELLYEADRQRYQTYAEAHADLCNRLYGWLKALDSDCTLSMCPTDYHGSAPFSPYIYELGEKLHPEIDIFYTGRDICAPEVTTEEMAAFASAVHRQPLLWDNYPVNDLTMQSEMHIGPICKRDADLYTQARGILVNAMSQAEASKIPLLTYGDYMAQPEQYDPTASWEKAIYAVAGEESAPSLRLFAENSLYSCLGVPETEKLQPLVDALLASMRDNEPVEGNPAAAALDAYFDALDEATYHLKYRMDNFALRNNLAPWIEQLDLWLWMGRRCLMVLRAIERGTAYQQPLHMMGENLADAKRHHKRIAGHVLLPLAEYVQQTLGQLA